MPFLATMPTTMIMPMNEATLNVVRVTRSARKPPNVERRAEARMATGAEKVRNSKSSTTNNSTSASRKTVRRSRKDFCCSSYKPPYSTRMDEGRCSSATAFFTAFMPEPSPTPSNLPLTWTSRCRFSRRISVWPGSRVTVAREPSVAVRPEALVRSVLLMRSSEARFCAGKRTRMV